MSFLHGVETFEYLAGPIPIRSLRTSVIGLVGTAPIQDLDDPDDATINEPIVCTNAADDAKYFGADTAGYSIPAALKAIRAFGTGIVVVVNVFDPDVHLNETPAPDPAEVVAADIIGTTSGAGVRSGMQAWLDAKAKFGFQPRLLLAPGFSNSATVTAAMRTLANKLRAISLIDAPYGSTVAAALAGRTGIGHVFNSASERDFLLFPYLKAAGPAGDPTDQPYSQFMAGAIAAQDLARGGPHWSPSNMQLQGVVGVERLITGAIDDPTTEAQLLNEQGITTYLNEGGLRIWGNRSAAYPTVTSVNNFISVRRTADIIEDSIAAAQLQHKDKPLTLALMDQIVADVNGFMREKIGAGWLIEGRCWVDPADNPLTNLAAGNPTYRYEFMPPVPNERTTFKAVLNSELLSVLLGG